MILNSNNIQKWLFDYFEGELTTAESKQVEQFILDNPEFHPEYIAWKDSIDAFQNNDEVPAYSEMENLLIAAPLIQSFWFRTAASFTLLFLSSISGIYIWMESEAMSPIPLSSSIYSDNTEVSAKEWKEFIYEKNVDNINFIESEINLFSKSLSLVNKLTISKPNAIRNENKNNNVSQNNSNKHFTSSKHNYVANSIRIVSRTNHSPNSIRSNNSNLHYRAVAKQVRKGIKYKGLNYNNHRENRKKPRYKFLNYRNENVKGITKPKRFKDKTKRKRESALFPISERFSKENSGNKKRSLKSRFKYMELGLENINDPIFITNSDPILFTNPSLTGQMGYTRINTTYRNQFFNESNNAQFASVSVDTYLKRLKAGIGFQTSYIHLNNFDYNTYSLNYAQKIEINRFSSLSVGTTISIEKVRHNGLAQGMEINPSIISNLSNIAAHSTQLNLGLSTWYSGKTFYGGINVTNILNPSLYASQESKLFVNQLDYSIQFGTDYKRSTQSNTVVSPFFVLNNTESQSELWTGSSIRHKYILFGLGGSTNLSAKAIIGVQSHSFKVSYGYDLIKSSIKDSYIGSHSLSMRLLLGVKKNSNILDY